MKKYDGPVLNVEGQFAFIEDIVMVVGKKDEMGLMSTKNME